MLSKHTIRGRQSLALVASIDAFALALVFVLLLLAVDDFEAYDFLLASVHLLHLFTAGLAYDAVRRAITSLDTLRILVIVYLIVLIVDIAVLIARIILLGHTHDDRVHRHMNELVRVVLALLFVFIDASGALFTNVAQHSAFSLYYTNDQLATVADQQFYKSPANA